MCIRDRIPFQIACALKIHAQLFPQGGDGLRLVGRVGFEHLHAGARRRKTRGLFIVLGLQGRRSHDARVTLAYDSCELDFESRDALALLRNGSFHRVAQLARRNSGGFLLGDCLLYTSRCV